MKRLLAVFLCLVCAGSLAQAQDPGRVVHEYELQIFEDREIARKLIMLEKQSAYNEIIEVFRDIDDGEEMREALLWLRGRVMADDTPDPRYGLLYAETLLRIIGDQQEENQALMETAAMVYLYGHLTLVVDAQRCLNREASWDIISPMIDPFQKLVVFYKELPEDKRHDILAVAMRLEDRVSEREPNPWICKNDGDAEENAQSGGGDRVEEELFSLMQDLELQPRYISERIWKERRKARRRAFARQFR